MDFKGWLLFTEEKKIKVPVPEVNQQTDYTCGVAALRAIFHYYGITKQEKEMEKMLKSNSKDGTHTRNIIKVAHYFGFQTKAKHNMDPSDLRKWLDENKPVMVVMQAKGTEKEYKNLKNGHYLVVIGYDDQYFYFEDPASDMKNRRGKIGVKEFMHRWKDVDGDDNMRYHWGVAIWKNKKPKHKEHIRLVKPI